jgi:hypothetical protein
MKIHPHADATYRVVSISESAFSVEVTIPDRQPAMISSFPTVQAAEAWIEGNRQRVTDESQTGRWFVKPGGNGFRR